MPFCYYTKGRNYIRNKLHHPIIYYVKAEKGTMQTVCMLRN